ncbi:MFS transporter [Defluviimonas sp. SAOS-178_SWC]|uniref:MFS transporter n=1 Tax=Defluviimonas sp. SAOS-178_SWC TaxID=3121287 RepID=UPI00322193DA
MERAAPAAGARPHASIGMIVLIVLIALNLRPFLTAPGPILPMISGDTGMGYGALSLLTILPMLIIGIGAFAAPGLQAVFGTRRGLLAALAAVALGSLLRGLGANGPLLVLTAALCGAGVAFIQSAIPGLIKARFPTNVAAVTGLYSGMIMAGGAIGGQLTPALTAWGIGWPQALAWLSVPAFIALGATLRMLPHSRSVRPERGLTRRLLRLPRTWTLILLFGLVNGGYSSLVTWLAPFYQDRGWSLSESGTLIVTMALSQAVSAIVLPLCARNGRDRRPWFGLSIALQAAGFAGLAFLPDTGALLWSALCGAGLAATFAFCIVIALDHLPSPNRAGPLAAVMQGGGFLITALPPFILALIHDRTGSFTGGWILHLTVLGVAALLCLRLDPKNYAKDMGSLGASA